MAVNFLLKRSNTASKRPTAAQLDIGELSLNYDANTAGVFFEDGAGNVRKVGPTEVGTAAPNATPAGSAGNSRGEMWFDTSSGVNKLKVYNGTAFVDAIPAAGNNTELQFNSSGAFGSSSSLTWDGSFLSATQLKSTQSSGDEGGQIDLAKAVTNTTLTTGVSIDVYQNRLRIFETGGTSRGYYLDISSGGAGAGTQILTGATAVSSFSAGTTGLTPSTATTGAVTLGGTLAVANGGTGVTTSTGSGSVVLSTTPSLTTPALSGETFSTSATVTAGTNAQGQGALTSDYNIITTAAANPSGVTLPTATTGRRIIVVNRGANPINVYPATGGTIDALAANASIQIAVGGVMMFNASSTTQWYSTTNLVANAGFLTGTIPSGVLGNSSLFIGTTSIALNRASASQALTGITSIDGSAATLTTTRTLWGQNFNGSANVTGSLTSVTDITATGTITGGTFVPSSSTAPTNGLYLPAANTVGLATNSTERLTINSAGRIIHSTSTSSGGGGFITRTGSGATDSAIILTGTGATFGNYIFSVEGDLSGNVPLTLRASYHEIGDGTTNFLTASSASVSLLSTAATALNLNSGTTGAVTLDSGTTGAVNIGNNANAKTITLGNTTGATTINVNSGTGGILVTSPHLTMVNQGEVRFREQTANGTNYIGLEAPASVAADLTFFLPGTDGTTTSGYTLKSNGSAALSFGTANIVTADTAPSSPLDGDLWYNSSNGRLFVYYSDANTNQWVDASPDNSVANIRQLDDLSSQFNGSTTAFTLKIGGANYTAVAASQLLIAVGGVLQTPGSGYTVSGTTITFTSAPPANATFSGIVLAQSGFFAAGGTDTQVQYNNAGTLAGTSLMTITSSVNVAADILPTTDNVRNLGSASLRFANVYTGDLHLKNDRGDWTIIEEEDCLTMRNNKTGKVYNIMMTERTA